MSKNAVKNTARPLNTQPSLSRSRTSPPPERRGIEERQGLPKQAAAETASTLKTPAPAVRVEFAPTAAKVSSKPLDSLRPTSAPQRGEASLSQGVPPQKAPIATSAPKPSAVATATPPKALSMTPPTQPGKPVALAQPQKPTAPKTINVNLALLKPDAKQVWLSGDFNGWSSSATPMKRRKDGQWETTVALTPGRYQYKFIVDGEWIPDPNAKQTMANAFGSLNSVLDVRA